MTTGHIPTNATGASPSDAAFQPLADSVAAPLWMLGVQSECRFVNHAWLGLRGRSRKEELGQGWMDGIHPADLHGLLGRLASAQTSQEGFEAEYRVRNSSGGYSWLRTTAQPLVDETGHLAGHVGTSVDITAEKAVHDELRLSDARYRALADTLPQFIWSATPDGATDYVNDRWLHYSGLTFGESLGSGWAKVIHPDDLDRVDQHWRECLATGALYEAEFRLRSAGGDYRWFVARAMPLRGEDDAIRSWFGSCTDIHDLRVASARYRMLADALPDIVWAAAPNGDVIYYNERWFDYTGLTPDESGGWGWQAVIHPDDVSEFKRRWLQSLERSEPFEVECRILGTDGNYRWHIGRAIALRDDSSGSSVWFGTYTDVHGRKQAEEQVGALNRQLQLRLADLETLREVIPIGIGISHDRECRDIRVNNELARMLGMTIHDNGSVSAFDDRGQPPYRVFAGGRQLPAEEFVMQRAASTRESLQEEYRIIRADGEGLDVLAFAAPLLDGEQPRGAIGAFVDLTEVNRTQAALLAAEARYHAAGDAIPFGVWAADANGLPTYVSPSLLDMVGGTMQDLANPRWYRRRHREVERATMTAWADCVATGANWDHEQDILGVDGAWHTVLVRGRPVFDADGTITGYAGISLDITDRRQMEQALSAAVDELQKANAVKDELLGLVSHELRTPLTTISGNAQALRRHGHRIDEETRATALQDIEDDAARLQRLIENMLLLGRVEQTAEVAAEPVLLQRFLPRFMRELGSRFANAQISIDVPADLPPVLAQPGYLDQILRNLLGNAVKYSPPGSPVQVRVVPREGEVALFVEDRGHGITADEAEHVFSAFFRSQRTASLANGMGLGLAVCKRLVEVQGGTVWAEPRDGGGARIGFTLPVIDP